jgi:2-keto-4-pentenoate hydratase/2-oxohepta-3-ene-1,7-dioic acid hydratase in catechol pathway
MKIVRFESGGATYWGEEAGNGEARRIEGDLFRSYRVTGERLPVARRLAPVVPTDILCIGLNYRAHAAETGARLPEHPVLFMKASNTLNHPDHDIPLPRRSQEVDYEGELAVVIGRTATAVPRERALEHVLGYTCANDVTARNWQIDKTLGGGQFVRGKSCDGFAPMGPVLVTSDEIPNPNALRLTTTVSGRTLQDSTTADMIFDVPTLIAELSSTMTLRAGAVIFTGTPQGVGFVRKPPVYLQDGDVVVVEIEGIGRLVNTARRTAAAEPLG